MAMEEISGGGSLNPKHIFELLKYRTEFRAEHPEYFDPDGLLVFAGPQGSGKTLSAVNYVYNLLEAYPQSKLVTNLMLTDYPIVTYEKFLKKFRTKDFIEKLEKTTLSDEQINEVLYRYYLDTNRVFPFINNDDLQQYDNGERGVIFLIDEIQLYMNSLESKNINMEVMTQISQQRKQRKHIVCTSQVFGRMAKPLREQFSSVVVCKCMFRCLQNNMLVDRDDMDGETSSDTTVKGTCSQRFVWFHTPAMYKRYDTYYVIEKGKFADAENRKGDIYGTGLSDNY